MQNETVTLQGKDFTLKPFNRYFFDKLMDYEQEASEKMQAGEMDRFEYYKGSLELITEDGRKVEEVITDFLPESMRTAAMLQGF